MCVSGNNCIFILICILETRTCNIHALNHVISLLIANRQTQENILNSNAKRKLLRLCVCVCVEIVYVDMNHCRLSTIQNGLAIVGLLFLLIFYCCCNDNSTTVRTPLPITTTFPHDDDDDGRSHTTLKQTGLVKRKKGSN